MKDQTKTDEAAPTAEEANEAAREEFRKRYEERVSTKTTPV